MSPSGSLLFVSDQDSGFVSWFSIGPDGTASPEPTSRYLEQLHPDGNYPAGSFVGCKHPPDGWQKVKVRKGGLGRTTKPKKRSVRGFAFAGSILYVADEVNDRVAVYDAGTGDFLSDLVISGNGLAGPVGIALHPDGRTAYVGSPGTAWPDDPKQSGAVYRFTVGTGGLPTRLGYVKSPSGLAFAGGSLYVASRKKKKIRRWTGSGFETFAKGLPDEPECLIGLSTS